MSDQAQKAPTDLTITYHLMEELPVAVARHPDGRPYHAVRYDEDSEKLKGDAMIFMAFLDGTDIDEIDRAAFLSALQELDCSGGPDWLNLS
ncbi:MAG: hypothetical protein KI792_09405 [Alphaproteobacteria bacterium]|nr:hypothetical protein [Alphaproteobacteria bacterium SS10]